MGGNHRKAAAAVSAAAAVACGRSTRTSTCAARATSRSSATGRRRTRRSQAHGRDQGLFGLHGLAWPAILRHAALKKFDFALTKGHCKPTGYSCTIYIYNRSGGSSGGGGACKIRAGKTNRG